MHLVTIYQKKKIVIKKAQQKKQQQNFHFHGIDDIKQKNGRK
jgi:hypothetical protein